MKDLKTKKKEELLKMTILDVKMEIKDAEKSMFSLKMKHSLGELKQPHMIK
jgi:ribosomal protein L29